jgi:hypothetical protein
MVLLRSLVFSRCEWSGRYSVLRAFFGVAKVPLSDANSFWNPVKLGAIPAILLCVTQIKKSSFDVLIHC